MKIFPEEPGFNPVFDALKLLSDNKILFPESNSKLLLIDNPAVVPDINAPIHKLFIVGSTMNMFDPVCPITLFPSIILSWVLLLLIGNVFEPMIILLSTFVG